MKRLSKTSITVQAIITGVLMLCPVGFAQQPVIPVWPGVAPGSEQWTQTEAEYLNPGKQKMVRNIVSPTLTAYLPSRDTANGTAVIVCPGGGFRFLSWQSEGTDVAQWLAARGVAAFVLKYRLVNTGASEQEYQKAVAELFARINRAKAGRVATAQDVLKGDLETDKVRSLAISDGRQAVKVVRQRAAEWGISPDRIGIMGFSAGAVVTMGVVMDHEADSRPNFAAPIYGGGTGGAAIPSDAPPLFILAANDDTLAAAGSAKLYSQWNTAGLPVELHIYSKGGHGFGMNKRGLPVDHWVDRLGDWLESQGLFKPPALR